MGQKFKSLFFWALLASNLLGIALDKISINEGGYMVFSRYFPPNFIFKTIVGTWRPCWVSTFTIFNLDYKSHLLGVKTPIKYSIRF